jgi:hypothetical protein
VTEPVDPTPIEPTPDPQPDPDVAPPQPAPLPNPPPPATGFPPGMHLRAEHGPGLIDIPATFKTVVNLQRHNRRIE